MFYLFIFGFNLNKIFCRVTPEEIYQAEKSGRDLAWPGSEVDMPEEEINEELNEEVEYSNGMTMNHTNHSAHHDSHTSLSNVPSNGYTLPAQEPTYNCSNSVNEEPTSSPSCSNTLYQANGGNVSQGSANRSSGSHLNYGNGHNGNNKDKATNMAKSNSLSDYNLYHNGTELLAMVLILLMLTNVFLSHAGNYRSSSPPPLSANNYEPSEYSYENGHSNNQAQAYSTPTYHQNGSTRTIQSSASSQPRLLPKGGKNRVRERL